MLTLFLRLITGYGLNMVSSFSLFFFKKSLISSAEIPCMKASLISVTHSSSMYWSFVSALPVTTYPPIIVRQLGHHSLKP